MDATMQNLRGQHNWVELPVLVDRPNFHCFMMPDGAPVFSGNCVVCAAEGKMSRVGARTPTKNCNMSQKCGTGTHSFLWKKVSTPAIVLDGYDPAHPAPANPEQAKCARPGCQAQHLAKCAHHRCQKCCVTWAKQEYEAGRDPLNLCGGHRKAVEAMIIADQKELEASINASQGTQAATSGSQLNARQPAPTPTPAPIPPRSVARFPAALATPVVRLPSALPFNNPADLYETPGMLRQQRFVGLNRLGREKESSTAERRIKVFWWRSDGSKGIDSLINTQGSANLFVPGDHPQFSRLFERGGEFPTKLVFLDWEDGYWTAAALATPQALDEEGRVLVREIGMVDGDCEGLEGVMMRKGKAGGGDGTTSATQQVSSRKRPRHSNRVKVDESRPPTSPPSSASSAPPPSPPAPPPKRRRLSAKSKSFFMRTTYKQLAKGFVSMAKIQQKGVDAETAFYEVFPSEKWAKETFRRHRNVFNAVDADVREDWLTRKPNHLWADFWTEYSHLTYTEEEAASGMDDRDEDEGVNSDADADEEEEEEEEDLPLNLKLEDILAGKVEDGKQKGARERRKRGSDIIEISDSSGSESGKAGPSFQRQAHGRKPGGYKHVKSKVKSEQHLASLGTLNLTSSDEGPAKSQPKKEKVRLEDQKTREGRSVFHVAMEGNKKMYVIEDSD